MATNKKKKEHDGSLEDEPALTPGMTGGEPAIELSEPIGDFAGSRTQDQHNWGYQNPVAAARAWMNDRGINPNSANPLIQNMLRSAYGARSQFDLSSNLGPAQDFMSFLGDYMSNRDTPGASPMFSREQIDEMLRNVLGSVMTHGSEDHGLDGAWGARLGAAPEVDAYGNVQSATLEEQLSRMQQLFAGAYQDVMNPWAQQAQRNMLGEQMGSWQDDILAPGRTAEQQTDSFVQWLVQNGLLGDLAASQ